MPQLLVLLSQRRLWAALIPVAVIAANFFGVPLTEGLLSTGLDKAVALVPAALALWSYLAPKPAAP